MSLRVSDIIERLDMLAPFSGAESWDNVGLLVGRPEKKVGTVFIALDATDEAIDDALESGADLLLTHHPMIFSPLKKVVSEDFVARRVMELVKRDLSYIAMHTNFDVYCMGKAAADIIGLNETEALEGLKREDASLGFGRIGNLENAMPLKEFADFIKHKFDLDSVRIYGGLSEIVERVAVLPGSGSSGIPYAIGLNADVLLTGDISHHQGIDANMQGLSIVDAGHYGIEHIFINYMNNYFREKLPELKVVLSRESSPFKVL